MCVKMNENELFINEINRLTEVLRQQKESMPMIRDLLKGELDRPFHTDLWELSDRELDNEMGNRLPFMNNDIDPKPKESEITSHRRLLGKPIVMVKRFILRLLRSYTTRLLEKQHGLNEQLVAFHLASFIRFKRTEERLDKLELCLKELSEDQELLLLRLNNGRGDGIVNGDMSGVAPKDVG